MATVAADGDERSLSIGRVFSRAFGTIASNPVSTLGIAFLFGALPSILINYAVRSLQAESLALLGGAGVFAIGLVTIVIAVALAMITQGALVRATVAHSEGRKASFGESAMAGLSVALPLFLVGLVSGLGIAFGLILLIVPGVMLYVMWSVAAPALVEERLGPIEALGRSSDLTRGARWKVFGLNLVILVVYWLFSILVGLLGVMWYGGANDMVGGAGGDLPLGFLIITAILQTFSSVVWGVIQSSLYVDLRDWKDGPPTEALAEIFG